MFTKCCLSFDICILSVLNVFLTCSSLQQLQRATRHQPIKVLHPNNVKVPSTEAGAVPSEEPVVPDETPRAAAGHRMMSVNSLNREDSVKVWRSGSDSSTLISDSPFPTAVLGKF